MAEKVPIAEDSSVRPADRKKVRATINKLEIRR